MNTSNEYKLVNDAETKEAADLRKAISEDMKAKSKALKLKYSKEYFAFCESYDGARFEPAFFKDRAFTISLRDVGIYE